MSWINIEINGFPPKDGLYFVTSKPKKPLEDGKFPMSEAALFSTKDEAFMATYMLTTLQGPMVITLSNVTHYMEVPEIVD